MYSLCLALGIYVWRWHLHRVFIQQHDSNHTSNNSVPLLQQQQQHGCDRDMYVNTTTSSSAATAAGGAAMAGNGVSRRDDSWYEVATCIARLGVVILYFFLCDR